MPLITIRTIINADMETCFDLARNIDFHKQSLAHSNEKAIAGKTSGLIELGESVTWEARHFGITQQLTSKITEYNRPFYFVDEMVSGPFKSFRHEHIFKVFDGQTIMKDKFHFVTPYGILGKLVNQFLLNKYMTSLLSLRNDFLKRQAEQNGCI